MKKTLNYTELNKLSKKHNLPEIPKAAVQCEHCHKVKPDNEVFHIEMDPPKGVTLTITFDYDICMNCVESLTVGEAANMMKAENGVLLIKELYK